MATPSYARVNYSIRPAKHVERRMIFEGLRRLDRISDLSTYRYIGFASPFFVDFRLAHKEIGIQALLNIEREVGDKARFEFNRPYGCIEMEFGEASQVLDELDWTQRSIVWLDYDKALDDQQLSDVARLAGNLPSGSVLLVSTNAYPGTLEGRIGELQQRLGENLPHHVDDPELLGGWSTAELYRDILHQVITSEVDTRNQGLATGAQFEYTQWFNFRYADGAKMLTVGGTIFDAGFQFQAQGMGLEELEFTRSGREAYEIEVPHLTHREMAHLESRFPCPAGDAGLDFLHDEEIARYAALYRYYPRYADVDL